MGQDTGGLAEEILALLGSGRQMDPITGRVAGFGLEQAYRVSAEITRLRGVRGERPVGRKIGFTNRNMWDAYGVRAPIWAPVYDSTCFDLAALAGPVILAGWPEPKIEPELVFGLSRAPEQGMDEAGLLGCVEWMALGFEVVQSVFPGWRFAAADTVAGFGLHAGLFVGEKREPERTRRGLDLLAGFAVSLLRDGKPVAEGAASHVLGGPLTALRHLNDLVAPGAWPLEAGEIITTGTLTLAADVAAGETWRATVTGISLAPVSLAFG